MRDKNQCCGTCEYHIPDGEAGMCTNPDSDYCCDYTAYNDTCDEWEERE